jgi:hypothetical protein
MRRSAAAILVVAAGALAVVAFFRRRGGRRERADLYFEDGSMLSLATGSPGGDRMIPLAREIIRNTSST